MVDLGHIDAGIAEIRKAMDLDPLSTAVRTSLAYHLYFARRYDESIAEAQHVLELDPNSSFAHARDTGLITGSLEDFGYRIGYAVDSDNLRWAERRG